MEWHAMATGQDLIRKLWRLFDQGRFAELRPLLADDFTATWPATREIIRGPDNFIALNRNYPGRWACELTRLVAAGDELVSEVRLSDGRSTVHALSFFTIRDGKIATAREFFADGLDPPHDRGAWAERY